MSVQNKPIRTSAEQAPYFKFYVSDFREIVDDWTAEEIGCYIMLLISAWKNDGLSTDLSRVYRIHSDVERNWPVLKSKFPQVGDRLRNPRQEREREAMISGSRHAAKGGYAKAAAQSLPKVCSNPAQLPAQSLPEVCSSPAISDIRYQIADSTEQITELKHTLNGSAVEPECDRKRKPASSISDQDCERVWELFPRKVGKKKAFALIRKVATEIAYSDEYDQDEPSAGIEVLCERVRLFAKECQLKDPQYIAHPCTWLNGGRYLDPIHGTESH
jgi:uncharacterized protein YdaU (DUF1376 family)